MLRLYPRWASKIKHPLDSISHWFQDCFHHLERLTNYEVVVASCVLSVLFKLIAEMVQFVLLFVLISYSSNSVFVDFMTYVRAKPPCRECVHLQQPRTLEQNLLVARILPNAPPECLKTIPATAFAN